MIKCSWGTWTLIDMNEEIIIIGAGLAGCTIARLLADNNHKIKIFEEKII